MKKNVLKELRIIAAGLPVFKVRSEKKVIISGKILRESGTKMINGKAVQDNLNYNIHALENVKHYNVLVDIYKKEGMEGVQEYATKIINHFSNLKRITD
jgi:hypothetical protein